MKLDYQPVFVSVFNLGTSAQLSVVTDIEEGRMLYDCDRTNNVKSKICVPYFGPMCLWTSASLNGGVVFDVFVTELYEWTKQFSPNVTKEDIYSKIQEVAYKGNVRMLHFFSYSAGSMFRSNFHASVFETENFST